MQPQAPSYLHPLAIFRWFPDHVLRWYVGRVDKAGSPKLNFDGATRRDWGKEIYNLP